MIYHQFWIKWVCIHIGNISGHIGQTHSRFQNYLWMFHTEWNANQIDILINGNLTNTSSTPLPEWEKTIVYIAHIIVLCTSTETSIY